MLRSVRAVSSTARRVASHARSVAAGAQPGQTFHLGALDFGIDAERKQRRARSPALRLFPAGRVSLLHVLVYAHHHSVAPLDGFLIFVGRLLDLALHVARFDGAHHAAHRIDLALGIPGPGPRSHR